ncbi:MAG: outer membrane protein assembly factor BamE, partial [Parasphingopyxis sp.]
MAGLARKLPLVATVAALVATSLTTSGCARIREHQGYIGDRVLIDSIEAGVDNRQSVQATLGQPSFTSQFTRDGEAPTWYYVTRVTRQLAFANPSPREQDITAVSFDMQGNVTGVRTIGLEQVASIDPYSRETPTLGRERSFFQELFGNIGQAGALGRT